MLRGAKRGAVAAIGAAIPRYAIPIQATTTDGGIQLLQEEEDERVHSHAALDAQQQASSYEIMASLSHYIPQGSIDAEPFGIGGGREFCGATVLARPGAGGSGCRGGHSPPCRPAPAPAQEGRALAPPPR